MEPFRECAAKPPTFYSPIASPPLRRRLTFIRLLVGLLTGLLASACGAQGNNSGIIDREDVASCMACHAEAMNGRHKVNQEALKTSPHKDLKCQDCHASITSAPHTPAMLKHKTTCGSCHPAVEKPYLNSAHSYRDRVAGDHPTCVFCHGQGDPHAVKPPAAWTRQDRVALCSQCHEDAARMNRYKADPDAVSSYRESFHGKALLRFGNQRVAICTDCHGVHGMLSPRDPAATTNRLHAAQTCARVGCHAGARVNFAMSGANHLRLKIKDMPLLLGEIWFFRFMIVGIIGVMLFIIVLDLRKQVFVAQGAPRESRLVGSLICFGFFNMQSALGVATFQIHIALWMWGLAIATLLAAWLVYLVQRKPRRERSDEPVYVRWSVAMRVQHVLLMISFTLLACTGLPLRFANVPGVSAFLSVFGGLSRARLLHRGAGMLLVCVFLWHVGWLLYRWHKAGYTLRSWNMLPSRKDLHDVVGTIHYYLGWRPEEPRFDRYQFRSKMDYWAEWWGIPLIAITGMVLWFPIGFGNRLPEAALSFALIAHSYEATLAFLAILTWHLYNVQFNPRVFPMNHVWYTGILTRTEMEHEHPLELERLEQQERGASSTDPPLTDPPPTQAQPSEPPPSEPLPSEPPPVKAQPAEAPPVKAQSAEAPRAETPPARTPTQSGPDSVH